MKLQPNKWFTATLIAFSALFLSTSAKSETLLSDFENNFFFDGAYAGWYDLTGPVTNWSIFATNFGGAVVGIYMADGFTPTNADISADDLVELKVTVSDANATAGPQVLLQDGDGTRLRYSWYGLGAGSYTLVEQLSAGVIDGGTATGSIAGLDLSDIVLFHIQTDPGGDPDPYTLILENLRTLPTPPPPCETLVTDFDNQGVGGYGAWTGGVSGQPDNLSISATGFGGGWADISPNLDATGEPSLELSLTVNSINDDNTGVVESVGSTVVLQDGDGTQNTWGFFGLTNGTSYVLTDLLSNGNPVTGQEGTVAGFDKSDISFFHVQVDDGGSNWTYTVTFENLKIFGFNPEIGDFTYDSGASEFDLIWNSRPGRSYSVSYVSDLTGSFSVLTNGVPSGGTSTTNTVSVPAGDAGFLQVSEECQ